MHPVFAMVDKWDKAAAKSDDGTARRAAEFAAKERTANESYARYKAIAPPPSVLDELERRAKDGFVRAIRQEKPGVYRYVGVEQDTGAVYVGSTLPAVEQNQP